jgi:SOS-response transcriptional repressor LexA
MSYQGDETTGFQSPAQDYVEAVIDLPALLDLRKPGLYPVRVKGQQLRTRGIHHGDILIANAGADPAPGKVCVAFIHGEVVLATLVRKDDRWFLAPAQGEPQPVTDEIEIWAMIQSLVRLRV